MSTNRRLHLERLPRPQAVALLTLFLATLFLATLAVRPIQAQPGDTSGDTSGDTLNDPPTPDRLAEAPYIVAGTVVDSTTGNDRSQREASSEEAAEHSVRVDQVLLQQGTFSDLTGRLITVVTQGARLEVGMSYQLWLEPFRFDASVAARLVEAKPIDLSRLPSGSPRLAEKKATLARAFVDRGLAVRLQAADVVVAGRVESVRQLDRWQAPESEHQPELFEATVAVGQTLKGSAAGSRLRFIFAASHDVHWYRAPRVAAGDDGLFLLRRADDATADFGVEAGELTLFHRDDRRPATELHRVREILR